MREPTHFMEQRTLTGGSNLQATRRQGKRSQTVHTDGRVGFAAALALVIEHGKRARTEERVPALSTCPRCGRTAPTEEAFGMRLVDGALRPQSWCRACRSNQVAPPESRLIQEAWDFARQKTVRKPPRPLLELTPPPSH